MNETVREVDTGIVNKLSHPAAHDLQGLSSGEDVTRSGTAGREEIPGKQENYSYKVVDSRDQIHVIVRAISSEPNKEFRMSFSSKEAAIVGAASVIDELIEHPSF